MRNNMKRFFQLVMLITWGSLVLIQHIAAFDVFDSNSWHLYLIACGAAFLHYLLLCFFRRTSKSNAISWFCGIVYGVGACGKMIQLFLAHSYQPYPLGLTILCLILDALGVFIILFQCRGLFCVLQEK